MVLHGQLTFMRSSSAPQTCGMWHGKAVQRSGVLGASLGTQMSSAVHAGWKAAVSHNAPAYSSRAAHARPSRSCSSSGASAPAPFGAARLCARWQPRSWRSHARAPAPTRAAFTAWEDLQPASSSCSGSACAFTPTAAACTSCGGISARIRAHSPSRAGCLRGFWCSAAGETVAMLCFDQHQGCVRGSKHGQMSLAELQNVTCSICMLLQLLPAG